MRPGAHTVAVVGAGAAGLAAARRLRAAGVRVVLVEARDRLGGRMCSVQLPDFALPIELGAEFVHGGSDTMRAMTRAARLLEIDAGSEMRLARGGSFEAPGDGIWEAVERFVGRLRDRGVGDTPLTEELEREARGDLLLREAEDWLRRYVEGFHAADPARMSARGFVDSEGSGGSGGGDNRRLLGGFQGLVRWLAAGLDPSADRVLLGTVVRRIRWSPGNVRLELEVDGAEREPVVASRAIVTVPLGVLSADPGERGAIELDPPVPSVRRAAARLAMGHVVRVTLRFECPFWEDADTWPSDLAFFTIPGAPLPVFWTQVPLRVPLLTGWAGGPGAEPLAARGEPGVLEAALESLGQAFGEPRERLRAWLRSWHYHDWTHDPFARGAYSWVPVGGLGAHAELSRPVGDTLHFAGEATHDGGDLGTVHGALETGIRAAEQVLDSL